MTIAPNTQRLAILRAMIANPNATLQDIRSIVYNEHQHCAVPHIKKTMELYGITRVRTHGAGYKFNVPLSVINQVKAVDNGEPVTKKSRVDRVWTAPMKKGADWMAYHFHSHRMSLV